MRRVILFSSPNLWGRGHGPQHPLKSERLQKTHELLRSYGALELENVQVVSPQSATKDELALFHTPEYIQVVRDLSAGQTQIPAYRYGFGPGDNPVFEGMYESEGLKVGGALQGVRMLMDNHCDVAFNYAGGLHHAGPDFASGFCVFNDIAVAIQWLVREGLRVAYIDIDVHHGDGVQHAFDHTDQVLTVSLHQSGRTLFPGTGFVNEIGHGEGQGFSINVPLPPFTDDDIYLWAFRQVVLPSVKRFQPDVLVTQLGVDTHFLDPLASLALTTNGHKALFEELSALSPGRWLALGGGGYNLDVVPRSWALAFAVMTEQTFPDELPQDYRANFGGNRLQDDQAPQIDEHVRTLVRRRVEEVVNEVSLLHNIE
ncbi:MAG: acetoin utilization protein AcuC [Anaerolineales bacterium]|nr:acetoin utilization protein AcuC [Anaerolineales bacterium]